MNHHQIEIVFTDVEKGEHTKHLLFDKAGVKYSVHETRHGLRISREHHDGHVARAVIDTTFYPWARIHEVRYFDER